MMRKWVALGVALILAIGAAGAGDRTRPGKPTAQAAGLKVQRGLDAKNYPIDSGAATALSVLLKCPGQHILKLDPSSRVTAFRDDKGTDFLAGNSFGAPEFRQSLFANDRSSTKAQRHFPDSTDSTDRRESYLRPQDRWY